MKEHTDTGIELDLKNRFLIDYGMNLSSVCHCLDLPQVDLMSSG